MSIFLASLGKSNKKKCPQIWKLFLLKGKTSLRKKNFFFFFFSANFALLAWFFWVFLTNWWGKLVEGLFSTGPIPSSFKWNCLNMHVEYVSKWKNTSIFYPDDGQAQWQIFGWFCRCAQNMHKTGVTSLSCPVFVLAIGHCTLGMREGVMRMIRVI